MVVGIVRGSGEGKRVVGMAKGSGGRDNAREERIGVVRKVKGGG